MKETAQWYIFTIFCLVTFFEPKIFFKIIFLSKTSYQIARNCSRSKIKIKRWRFSSYFEIISFLGN